MDWPTMMALDWSLMSSLKIYQITAIKCSKIVEALMGAASISDQKAVGESSLLLAPKRCSYTSVYDDFVSRRFGSFRYSSYHQTSGCQPGQSPKMGSVSG